MLATRPTRDPSSPLISVVMASYRAGPRLVRALDSVQGQSVDDLEIIVSDDASGDDSAALVRRAMASDTRIRLIEAECNGGPARARNRALDMARGQWIAIVDADDIIHPERFERLLAAAAHFDADAVADDLLHFHEDGAPVGFLLGERQRQPFGVAPSDWVLAGISPDTAPLGYLKPMIKAASLGALRYDESLRIAEDYDLVLRLLLAGARLQVIPQPWYLYRRHGASISHRLSGRDLGSMIDNQQRLMAREGPFPAPLQAALELRLARLRRSRDYEGLVEAIKRRRIGPVLKLLAGRPWFAARLWASLRDRQRNRSAVSHADQGDVPAVLRLGEGLDPAHHVPPYIDPQATDWADLPPRAIWAALANLGGGAMVSVQCDDAAGRYAAGFMPMAQATRSPAGAALHPEGATP
ncbi:glycosyltransferase family 2 protein [uncultured Devosia sp.]|uniref:glycosyltransferase family 2 protein n=1 Tax=uncultured Devosia sp. TaxID=211434 RepID=UPI0035CAB9CC